ncbi:MAG: adenylate/guanylate cyclase domain-containing protein [Alphaproteobacteria bacterium]|nr:adenylate/guanylate cyclase domain-containing protein [Alphaproteobacteria bacterium]
MNRTGALKVLARGMSRLGVGRAVAAALAVALAALRIVDPAPLEELRLRSFDLFQLAAPRRSADRPAVIIDIDDTSLHTHGQWPWPRTLIAELINRLTDLGAAAIGFDVIFAEPDRYSPGTMVELVRDLDEQTRRRISALPSNDRILADALGTSRVVLGQSGITEGGTPTGRPRQIGIASIGGDPAPNLIAFPGMLRNLPILEDAAAGAGMLTIRPERDGIVRRVPLAMLAQGTILPSLGLEMLRVVAASRQVIIRSDRSGVQSIGIRGLELPTDRNGQIWVHFGHHDPARFVSAQDVLGGRVPRERIVGKLVLVGTSALGLQDRQTTPVGPAMPGVEIHAQLLENALAGSWIANPDYAMAAELMTALLAAGAIIALAPALGAALVAALGAAIAATLVGASWYLYAHEALLIDFTYPLSSTLAVYLVLVFANYLGEQARRRQIRSAFGQYLAPDLVEQLARAPEKLVLGGEEREMTIMFADVRGFTAIAEMYKDDPHGLTLLMNRLLTPLTEAIVQHRGTIDKYMGDAVMAFWNAPLTDREHAANACRAALEMNVRLTELNAEREREVAVDGKAFVPLRIGIGVNTGRCVVGNMGSDFRFNYTVLGDPVNLTSRIEGQAKVYGVSILAGAGTVLAAGEAVAALELDLVRVKGKTTPEVVYGILGGAELAATERFRRLRESNARMLSAYRNGDWRQALDAVEACRAFEKEYALGAFFDLYASRIHGFRAAPPESGWNGVYAAAEK